MRSYVAAGIGNRRDLPIEHVPYVACALLYYQGGPHKDPVCGVERDGLYCTREPRHDGPHVAISYSGELCANFVTSAPGVWGGGE